MVTSNVPEIKERCAFLSDKKFFIGDNVRIQYENWAGGVIGKVKKITSNSMIVDTGIMECEIPFTRIRQMRKVPLEEDFNTVPHYDEEEKEFWRTHWMTRDGLKKKTEDDIKMLKEFAKQWR